MNKTFFWREKNKLRKSKESMCQVIKDEYRMKYRKEYFEGFLNMERSQTCGVHDECIRFKGFLTKQFLLYQVGVKKKTESCCDTPVKRQRREFRKRGEGGYSKL